MTDETPAPDDEKEYRAIAAGWVALLAALAACMGGGFILAARLLPPLFGFDMDKPVGGFGAAALFMLVFCVLTVLLVYLSVIVWMVVARLFVPRETMYAIMTSGPTSRFDRWLFNLFCPKDEKA